MAHDSGFHFAVASAEQLFGFDIGELSHSPDDAASAVKDGTSNTNAPLLDTFPYLGLPGGGYQTEPGTTKAS